MEKRLTAILSAVFLCASLLLCLDSLEKLFGNNTLVIVFVKELGHHAVVLFLVPGEGAWDIGLLEQHVSNVFLIGKQLVNGPGCPVFFTGGGRNAKVWQAIPTSLIRISLHTILASRGTSVSVHLAGPVINSKLFCIWCLTFYS